MHAKDKVEGEVAELLARLARTSSERIKPEMSLYEDLGLDSLDVTEVILFLERNYDQNKVRFDDLKTVTDVIEAALGNSFYFSFEEEEKKKQHRWQQKRKSPEPPKGYTIPEAFLLSAERMKGDSACVDPLMQISYTRMKSLVLGLAMKLRNLPGDNVGVLLPTSIYFNITILALLFAGKVPVLLNWSLGVKALIDACDIADVKSVISSESFLTSSKMELSLPGLITLEKVLETLTADEKADALALARMKINEILEAFVLNKMDGEETAAILFTSGTEKTPKGVPLSHRNILSNQQDLLSCIPFKEDDVLFGMLPAFHVFGFSLTNLLPLLSGLRVLYHPNPLDFQQIAERVAFAKVTVLCTTPTLLHGLLSLARPELLQGIRLFVIGAEKAPEQLYGQIKAVNKDAQVIEGYGLTECSPVLTLNRPGHHNGVGYPLPRVELKILDLMAQKSQETGQEGLIYAKGPNVFKGYLNVESDPFVLFEGERWFLTGDLGYLDEKGALHFKGRLSRTVKVGGELVHLPSLELDLHEGLEKAHPGHPFQLALVGHENPSRGVDLVLITTLSANLELVNALLKERGFGNLLRVKEVKVVPSLPLLATGKINYRALEKM